MLDLCELRSPVTRRCPPTEDGATQQLHDCQVQHMRAQVSVKRALLTESAKNQFVKLVCPETYVSDCPDLLLGETRLSEGELLVAG
jgi:hypothetical protein